MTNDAEVAEFYKDFNNQADLAAWGWSLDHELCHALIPEAVSIVLKEELIVKQKKCLDAFLSGLQQAKILPLIRKYPNQMKSIFQAGEDLTADLLLGLFVLRDSNSEEIEEKVTAYNFFKRYIRENADKEIFISIPWSGNSVKQRVSNSVLQFTAGCKVLPASGLENLLQLEFLANDTDYQYPIAETCLHILKLPTVYTTYTDFVKSFNVALQCGMSFRNS